MEAHACSMPFVPQTDMKGCHAVLRQDCAMPALQSAGAWPRIIQSRRLYAYSINIAQQQPLALPCMQLVLRVQGPKKHDHVM